eukprot:2154076-Pyramimonas_sp.AAC.1
MNSGSSGIPGSSSVAIGCSCTECSCTCGYGSSRLSSTNDCCCPSGGADHSTPPSRCLERYCYADASAT